MSTLKHSIASYFQTTEDSTQIILELFREEQLARGEFHTEIGQRHTALSFLQSGHLRIFMPGEKNEITQWISSPGELVTDLASLVFSQGARRNIQALSNCTLYSISSRDYNRIPHLVPEWLELEKRFLASCFMTMEDRITSFIALNAEERYQMLFNERRELFQQIPLQYLASMLGMTPETFSRIRKQTIS